MRGKVKEKKVAFGAMLLYKVCAFLTKCISTLPSSVEIN